jgi:hypothetical protein
VLAFDMSSELIRESARDVYGPADTRRFVIELQALLAPPQPETAPLDPAFAKSIARPRKRQAARQA